MRRAQPSGHRNSGQSTQIGNLLKRRREELGLSQEAMAKKLGVSRAHLSRIEHGDYAQPSPVVLGNASKILDISADDLYLITGYVPYSELPSLRACLMARHPDWPEHAIDEIDAFYGFMCSKYKSRD